MTVSTRENDAAAFQSFVAAVLEPLPEGIALDTHYNALMRQARREAWRTAKIHTRLAQARFELLTATRCHALVCTRTNPAALSALAREEAAQLSGFRAAVAAQIRTPAPDAQAVEWKVRALKDKYLPLSAEEAAALIEADRAFLAAHPVRKSQRRTGSAS